MVMRLQLYGQLNFVRMPIKIFARNPFQKVLNGVELLLMAVRAHFELQHLFP